MDPSPGAEAPLRQPLGGVPTRWFTLLLLAACNADTPPDADAYVSGDAVDTDDAAIDTHACARGELGTALGTGVTQLEPLDPSDAMVMVDGPQSGWHIDVAGILVDAPELVGVDAVVCDTDGTVWFGEQASSRLALVGWDDAACEGRFYGMRALSVLELDMEAVCALAGQPATVEVTVTDLLAAEPASVTEVLDVTFGLDPNDAPFCP